MLAWGSRETATWPTSSGASPASARHHAAASAGKPAQCLPRLKHSSAAVATRTPSMNERRGSVALKGVETENRRHEVPILPTGLRPVTDRQLGAARRFAFEAARRARALAVTTKRL